MIKGVKYLQLARNRIIVTNTDDPTSRLALANLEYGLAKILYAQEYLGFPKDACFLGAPDFTITRSDLRWTSGFSYGGLLIWGDGTRPLVVLDARPNVCGTLLARFHALPPLNTLLQSIDCETRAEKESKSTSWSFTRRNHFFSIYRNASDGSQFYLFMHGCPGKVKRDSELSPGLYLEESKWLKRNCITVSTPFGELHVLVDEAASRYWEGYRQHEQSSKAYRINVARRIIGDFEILSNETHQGLINQNLQLLGCYLAQPNCLLPLTISMSKPAYIITAKESITEILKQYNVSCDIIGLLPYPLHKFGLLPHGSGYTMPLGNEKVDVMIINGARYFSVDIGDNGPKLILSQISSIPFSFREKLSYIDELQEYHLDVRLTLDLVYCFKV